MANKRQHWLPSAYIQFFSVTGIPQGRDTRVYCTDASQCKLMKCEKVAFSFHHYSKAHAESVEKEFQRMENDYPLLVQKIIAKQALENKDRLGLILIMVDLHARNPSYDNLTAGERDKAYNFISKALLRALTRKEGSNLLEMARSLSDTWDVRPVHSTQEPFISSDHPSLLFSIDDKLEMIFLPITPRCGLIGFDKKKIEIVSMNATPDDIGLLNGLQVTRSYRYVISDHDLSGEIGEGKPITKLTSKERTRGSVDDHSSLLEYVIYRYRLSFVRILNV